MTLPQWDLRLQAFSLLLTAWMYFMSCPRMSHSTSTSTISRQADGLRTHRRLFWCSPWTEQLRITLSMRSAWETPLSSTRWYATSAMVLKLLLTRNTTHGITRTSWERPLRWCPLTSSISMTIRTRSMSIWETTMITWKTLWASPRILRSSVSFSPRQAKISICLTQASTTERISLRN